MKIQNWRPMQGKFKHKFLINIKNRRIITNKLQMEKVGGCVLLFAILYDNAIVLLLSIVN